jgi:hypothetical protein
MKLMAGLAALTVVLLVGCGSSSEKPPQASSFQAEVNGAMESIGNYIEGREAAKQSKHLLGVAYRCFKSDTPSERCRASAKKHLDLQAKGKRLLRLVQFDKYGQRAKKVAKQRLETDGLIGNGCEQGQDGWQC